MNTQTGPLAVGLASLLACLSACDQVAADPSARARERADATTLVGRQLPEVKLRALDGSEVSLVDRTRGHPSLVLVVSSADCLSCANYPLEVRVLRHSMPNLQAVLVGSDPDTVFLKEYFHREQIEREALLDHEGEALKALGRQNTPLILLLDTAGRIIFVDARASSQSSVLPISRQFAALRLAFGSRSVP